MCVSRHQVETIFCVYTWTYSGSILVIIWGTVSKSARHWLLKINYIRYKLENHLLLNLQCALFVTIISTTIDTLIFVNISAQKKLWSSVSVISRLALSSFTKCLPPRWVLNGKTGGNYLGLCRRCQVDVPEVPILVAQFSPGVIMWSSSHISWHKV